MSNKVRLLVSNFVLVGSLCCSGALADNPPAKDSKTTSTTTSKSSTLKATTATATTTKSVTKSDAKSATKSDSKSTTKSDSKSTTKSDSKSTTKPDSKSATAKSETKPAATPNLTGTWNVKFTESPTTKTHIMAVKANQKGNTFTATGVDQYGDVILEGSVTGPDKISFKRTYKGAQVNPAAQFEGTFTPAKEFTPVVAKGKWTAQPFADKSQKPKASSNVGEWEANIFTGPPINK